MTLKLSENTVSTAAVQVADVQAKVHPMVFNRNAANPFLGSAVFEVTPVFGAALSDEMLAVKLVRDGKATPLDLVPARALGESTVDKAARKLQAAFLHAAQEMNVELRPATRDGMAGWKITTEATGDATLEFVAKHFGVKRVEDRLLARTREHAHHDLQMDLGADHFYVARTVTPNLY